MLFADTHFGTSIEISPVRQIRRIIEQGNAMNQKEYNTRRISKIRISMMTALAVYFVFGTADLIGAELTAGNGPTKVTSSKHQQKAGMECTDCHEGSPPKPLSSKDCLSCHESFEAVAAATANSKPNPHDSPHYGKALDCELCHHEHTASENFCAQCHDRSLTVP
jgi:hypothetical protein